MTLKKNDLENNTVVFYCDRDIYSFESNWTSWGMQDSRLYEELVSDEIIFGAIIDGLFHYVEDTQ